MRFYKPAFQTKLFAKDCDDRTKPDVRYQKHKSTKPTFLRRKIEKSSLDLKYFWRRSDPVRTFTKKDEYMFLDFSDKGKNHSHSRLRRWNRSSL